MNRIFSNNLLCIAPVYTKDVGDSTKIYIENHNPFIIYKSLPTVLNLIYKYYSIDIKSLKKICSTYLVNQNLIPIPFDECNIFIPFKARVPKYKNDTAFGYLNLNYFHKYSLNENIDIIFKDNQSVTCISKEQSFKNHLNNGHIIKSFYKQRRMKVKTNYNYEDTSIDLKLIIEELSDIKYLIESKSPKL